MSKKIRFTINLHEREIPFTKMSDQYILSPVLKIMALLV